MKPILRKIIIWSPLLLGFLFAFFLGLFALDVFTENASLGAMIIGFIIHLLPSMIVVGFTLVGWRWPGLGAMLYIIIATTYIVMNPQFVWQTKAIISGPLYLVAALFLINNILYGRTKEKKRIN